jgi:hypothetical protein
MPSFCRHNHLIQNCPICSREQSVELRPVLSSSQPRTTQSKPVEPRSGPGAARTSRSRGPSARGGAASLRVSRLARGADDGYHSPLIPGLKSSQEAERLAQEIAFATARLTTLEHDPPGLYRVLATGGEVEERTWLGFLIAYLNPVDGAEDPFAWIDRVRTSWASGELPDLEDVQTGPRSAHDPARGTRTLEAYRAWVARSGSQFAAFTGDPSWTSERRFERVFERLALPGLHRDARFELLVTLGRLGVYELRAGALKLGGENEVTVAAKRALGIGDPLLLERRAVELALACHAPLEALDLALFNWGRGTRSSQGVREEQDQLEGLADTQRALGL